ncbi:MAG: MBL fold metallo-hydrolase [Mangrovibacterium sp.]
MGKLKLCAIASGSNGNCYYIGTENEAIVIDAGLSSRQLQLRMQDANINFSNIKAIIISHEHSDHARGARVLGNQLNVPVYMTKATYNATRKSIRPFSVRWFEANSTFQIGEFEIHAFSKQHDAADGCSFRVVHRNRHVGVITDLGIADENTQREFSQCEFVFLEANYNAEMLWNGSYPTHLKERVQSHKGHLSNEQACELVENYAGNNLHTILLSHLSAENNSPEIALHAFEHLAEKYQVELTYRHKPTKIYELS